MPTMKIRCAVCTVFVYDAWYVRYVRTAVNYNEIVTFVFFSFLVKHFSCGFFFSLVFRTFDGMVTDYDFDGMVQF